jgi:hypothetical protein
MAVAPKTKPAAPERQGAVQSALDELHDLDGIATCIDIMASNLEGGDFQQIPEIRALGFLAAQLNVHVRALGERLKELEQGDRGGANG